MATHRMKLDFNHLVSLIDDALSEKSIKTVQKNAFGIGVGLGLEMLLGYMKKLAEYAIQTEDEFLLQWCEDLMIVKEEENGKE